MPPGARIVPEPVSFVPAVVPMPLPPPELPSVDLSFFIGERPRLLFVPLIPLPDAPPCAFRQVPSSRPVSWAHSVGMFAFADGECVALPAVVPDVVADGVPDVVADGVPDVVADLVPDVVADGVPDVVPAVMPDVVVPAVVPEVVPAVVPDVDPDVPVAALADAANASAMAAASVHAFVWFMIDSSCLELATLDRVDRRLP